MKRLTTLLRNPNDFLQAIPKHITSNDELGEGNIDFRKRLHSKMAPDEGMYHAYLELCAKKPQILFNSAFWTYDPRAKPGCQNIPFILRPRQEYAVDRLKFAIDDGHNLAFDKSRDEGATEIICKTFLCYFLLYPDVSFLMGSRVEDYVDKATGIDTKSGRAYGVHKCLFFKILYGLSTLPPYMQPRIKKSHLLIENLDNCAKFDGEATTDNFGAGNRATAVCCDEMARVEPQPAQHIIDTIQDTSPCCIYNSTHFRWGAGHPFARLINNNKIEVVTLGYEDNPVKNVGLYNSPEQDHIIIKDIDYYRNKCPEIFVDIEPDKSFIYSDLQLRVAAASEQVQEKMQDVSFVADGGEGTFGCDRSLWVDFEEARPRRMQDLAVNVFRIPQGSADQFFDNAVLTRIEKKFCTEPAYTGTIKYNIDKKRPVDIKFKRGGPPLLKWWGPLPKGRPRQDHNYVVSCDISRGTGASNSVAKIFDVNTSEEVGVYVNPFIDVTDFAELAVALCLWCGGGTRTAFLIWEGGGPGDTFANRIRKIGYSFVYYKVDERKKTRKRPSNKQYGFYPTSGVNGTKLSAFGDLDAAIQESLQVNKRFPFVIIHDVETIRELKEYIFLGDRIDIGLSSQALDSSGARYAHGDRATASMLIPLAMKEQPKASIKRAQKVKKNSLLGRMQERNRQRTRDKAEKVLSKWLD